MMLAYPGVAMEAPGAKVSPAAYLPQPTMISFLPIPVSGPPSPKRRQGVSASSPQLNQVDLRPWVEAARNFEMNTDFDVQVEAYSLHNELDPLMEAMKAQSAGKWMIQALADKVMLSRMLDNLGVPQMPALLIVDRPNVDPKEIENFVLRHLCGPSSYDVVVKPTHMSNATGVINVSRPTPSEGPQMTIDYLAWHLKHFMQEKACDHESAALQSTRPGFIVQPKYQSVVDFKAPLEVRVVVLWGKARLAVWWWGHSGTSSHCHRNVWLVRCPAQRGELGEADTWQVIHKHSGNNPGFEKAIELFEHHMPAMADLAEVIANAVGAPFLRSDFFIGSPEWGVRLNEVAYGSGIEYMNFSGSPSRSVVDDSTAIAQILREGYLQCQRRSPSQHFLCKLGVRGSCYADMSVVPISPSLRPVLPPRAQSSGDDPSCVALAVPEELCATMPDRPARTPSKPCQSSSAMIGSAIVPAAVLGSAIISPAVLESATAAPNGLQSNSMWTPRGQSPARHPPQIRGQPISPRYHHSQVTPQTAPNASSHQMGSNASLWNSGSTLATYHGGSCIVPPKTTTADHHIRLPTPTRGLPATSCLRSPSLLRGPQRASQCSGPGEVLQRVAHQAVSAPGVMVCEEVLWRASQPGSVRLAKQGSGDALWRYTEAPCSSVAALPTAGEASHTPPVGHCAPRIAAAAAAPARTPPPAWRNVGVISGEFTRPSQAARCPRSQTPLAAAWQVVGIPPVARTPPPAWSNSVAA